MLDELLAEREEVVAQRKACSEAVRALQEAVKVREEGEVAGTEVAGKVGRQGTGPMEHAGQCRWMWLWCEHCSTGVQVERVKGRREGCGCNGRPSRGDKRWIKARHSANLLAPQADNAAQGLAHPIPNLLVLPLSLRCFFLANRRWRRCQAS